MQLSKFFKNSGFNIIERNSGDHFDFYAIKKGSNLVIMRYTDFFYVKNDSINLLTVEKLDHFHEASKKHANSFFKLPKALRLNIPNINSVLVVNEKPSQQVLDYLVQLNKAILGGEQDSIFIYSLKENEIFSSGTEATKITGEARLIWNNKKEFKTINGRNRAHNIMKELKDY